MSDSFNTSAFDPRQMPMHPALPGITAPFPVQLQEQTVYVKCTVPNHHMHRTDGKRLLFVQGIYTTRDIHDINYLRSEIEGGQNPYIRFASVDEIRMYNMLMDPRGTITRELAPAMEEKLREELSIELNNSLEEKLKHAGVELTQEQKDTLFGTSANPIVQPKDPLDVLAQTEYVRRPDDTITDGKKIEGSDALDRLKSQFGGGLKSGTGTFMGSIGGTDKMPNAGDSNASSDGGSGSIEGL